MAVEEDERQVFRIYEGLKTLAPGAKWIAADYESPTCPRSKVYPIANAIKNREPPKKQAGRFRKHLCPVSGAPLRLFGEDGGYRNPDLPEDEESTERNDAFFEEAGERNDGNGAFHFEVNNEIGDQNFDLSHHSTTHQDSACVGIVSGSNHSHTFECFRILEWLRSQSLVPHK